jgi:hypothetical protein
MLRKVISGGQSGAEVFRTLVGMQPLKSEANKLTIWLSGSGPERLNLH